MKNLHALKELIFLLFSIVVCAAVFFNITADVLKSKALGSENKQTLETNKDPLKEYKSLDNYIIYFVPAGWKKTDQVDREFGKNTLIALTSPDFDSPENMTINSGIRVIINRSYDPGSEETLKNKLNARYQFYDYNIRVLTFDNKNAMTMHEDYKGHNRFIYVANGDYLWQIAISSKSLQDEQKYEGEINSVLSSVKFKD